MPFGLIQDRFVLSQAVGTFTLILLGGIACTLVMAGPAAAIDVELTMEQAQEALAAGREPMLSANDAKEVEQILKKASVAYRVGADPVKDPCGLSAILRTKRFWLEAFGRKEAIESKKRKKDILMPEAKIRKVLETPHLEVEVQLCGDDEYFAEGAQLVFEQNSKNINAVDVSPAQKGRKNPGTGPEYRSRFTARFAYGSFDPMVNTNLVIFFATGSDMISIPADLSKVR